MAVKKHNYHRHNFPTESHVDMYQMPQIKKREEKDEIDPLPHINKRLSCSKLQKQIEKEEDKTKKMFY